MKKVLVAILTFLYVASTSGVSIHFHYCMGELVETGLAHDEKDTCSKCGMHRKKSSNSCCRDDHKFVKVEQGHEKSVFDFQALIMPDFYPDQQISYSTFTLPGKIITRFTHGPPLLPGSTPLFVRYCNFRI